MIIEIPAAEVPRKLFAACPKKNFGLVRVAEACAACPCFNHFLEVAPQAEDFRARYRVICVHPIARSMTEVDA